MDEPGKVAMYGWFPSDVQMSGTAARLDASTDLVQFSAVQHIHSQSWIFFFVEMRYL